MKKTNNSAGMKNFHFKKKPSQGRIKSILFMCYLCVCVWFFEQIMLDGVPFTGKKAGKVYILFWV